MSSSNHRLRRVLGAALVVVWVAALSPAANAQVCDGTETPEDEPEESGCFYPDTFNGGLNSDPPVYSPIMCETSVCGKTGSLDLGGYRDTDWYLITLDSPTQVTWQVTADGFPHDIAIIDISVLPHGETVGQAQSVEGETVTLTRCLPPGEWALVAAMSFDALPLLCDSEYRAEVMCEPCPLPGWGACCNADGSCTDGVEEDDCLNGGGLAWTEEVICSPELCYQAPRACCFDDGSCDDLATWDCTAAGGHDMGPDTACATVICEQGACCFDDGSCTMEWSNSCGGTFLGEGTDCATGPCPQPGACCLADQECSVVLAVECASSGGTFQGEGTDCPVACGYLMASASRDTTIYHPNGFLSNGSGNRIIADVAPYLRRGLIAFDLLPIPPGSVVTGVELKLYHDNPTSACDVGIHRLLADWGEGSSYAGGDETQGDDAEDGDATWLFRFFDAQNPGASPAWATPGGDYDPDPSAVAEVHWVAWHTWSSVQMIVDVQGWLDDPSANFGWLLDVRWGCSASHIGFRSRQASSQRPRLWVFFEPCITDAHVPTGFATIQEAINLSCSGSVITIAPGTYLETIDLRGRAITLRSEDPSDPDVVAATIIDGDGTGSVVTCTHGEGAGTVLDGLTIRGGTGTVIDGPTTGGGGAFVDGASPTFRRCVFTGNSADYGGGIMVRQGAPTIVDCVLVGNDAGVRGGGVFLNYSTPALVNCLITGNTAGSLGGGLMTSASSNPSLVNCTVVANGADSGGGLYLGWQGSTPDFSATNCVVWGNAGGSGANVVLGHGDATFTSCNIEGSGGSGAGWDAALGTDGGGNLDAAPLFVDPDGPDGLPGTEDDDLRLAAGSPCIDAGDNDAVPSGIDTDLDGNPRFVDDPATPDGGFGVPPIVDIGAYELQVASCPADVDGSGDTGFGDVVIVLSNWGPCAGGACAGDIDGDEDVGFGDLLAVLSNWGPCP